MSVFVVSLCVGLGGLLLMAPRGMPAAGFTPFAEVAPFALVTRCTRRPRRPERAGPRARPPRSPPVERTGVR